MNLVIDAETGQRGFLITGKTDYLEPYDRALATRTEQVNRLTELTEGKPEIQIELAAVLDIIEARDAELREAIQVRRQSSFKEAAETVETDLAKSLTDQIRGRIQVIRAEVETQLADAETKQQRFLDQGALLQSLAGGGALLSGLIGLALFIGHLRFSVQSAALEKEKEQAESADREKSRFLASMSHEIRTPLNAMLGFTELLEEEITTDRGRKYIQTVRESGDSLVELINDVLDLSKIESGILELQYESVSLRDFAQSMELLFSQQAADSGLELEVTVDEQAASHIVIDGLRIRQVLVNLIGNALKFTKAGSIRVHISTENTTSSLCAFRMSVADTGRGISRSKREEIFKPFRQAKAEDEQMGGTGLGLSINRELVSLMGGEISVESKLGEGSKFIVTIPDLEISSVAEVESRAAEEIRDFDLLEPSSVLVVDDNSRNRDLVAGYLEASHHVVNFAGNGQEALEQMERVEPDVVLMDIRMPIMDGPEARERIKANEAMRDVPIIAVTASSLLRKEKVLRREFDGYLRKPFSRSELFAVLDQSMSRVDPAAPQSSSARQESESRVEDFGSSDHDFPALITSLRELHDARWSQLQHAMVLSEVTETAVTLHDLGTRHGYSPVIAYAEELRGYAEGFEQGKLERALGEIDQIISEIPKTSA